MTTKADLMASIERVNQALQEHAKVVGAMPDEGAPQPVATPVSIQTDGTARQFAVKAVAAGIDTVKWVLANGTSGRWYGPIAALPVTQQFGTPVTPGYATAGDYVIVMWGGKDGMEKSMKLPAYAPTVEKPPVVQPPSVPATPVLDARFKFVAPMAVGTNQERLNMVGMMYNGVSVRRDRAYYDYLNGFSDHDRYFSPVNFTMDRGCGIGIPGMWAFDQLLDCAQQSILAGRRAIVSPLDVMDKAEYANWDSIRTWFIACAKRVVERAMDPTWFAFELANEWATSDMALFNKLNQDLYKTARGILPNHRLVVGGPEWNGWKRFDGTWQAPPDGDFLIQFHHYEALSVAAWKNILTTLVAFGMKHNAPVINGEVNVGFNAMDQKKHSGLWAANFTNYANAGIRVPMNPWAFIGGKNDFRMNVSGTDPKAIPLMEQTFKQCRTLLTT